MTNKTKLKKLNEHFNYVNKSFKRFYNDRTKCIRWVWLNNDNKIVVFRLNIHKFTFKDTSHPFMFVEMELENNITKPYKYSCIIYPNTTHEDVQKICEDIHSKLIRVAKTKYNLNI